MAILGMFSQYKPVEPHEKTQKNSTTSACGPALREAAMCMQMPQAWN